MRTLLLATFALQALAWPTKPKPNPKPPVCIVGAGPAGLTAASQLEKKGYSTVIFDKQPEIGGKCQAYYEDGNYHPLGAAFFSNATYTETVKVINSSGVLSTPFVLSGGTREQYRFNATTGATEKIPALSAAFTAAIISEVPRYIALWQQVFSPISVPGFKKGVPEELTVSAVEWFAKNNFTALPVLIVNPMALYGYGDVRVVPALYVLQYMTPDILTAFVGQHSAYLIDFHAVWVNWAKKSIKGPIYTNADVNDIDRCGDQPVVTFRKDSKQYQQKCSSVILAFPPTLENLYQAGLDLTPDEEDVFGPVGVHNYFATAVKFNLPYGVSYTENSTSPSTPPLNDGSPVAVLPLSSKSQIATSWSWGPYREYFSERKAKQIAIDTFSKINKDPRNATATSVPLQDCDIKAFRKWDYFPHFDTPQLKAKYYDKFNDLQGNKKTFWASGFNGMETVEWAIRAGQDIVSSYY